MIILQKSGDTFQCSETIGIISLGASMQHSALTLVSSVTAREKKTTMTFVTVTEL